MDDWLLPIKRKCNEVSHLAQGETGGLGLESSELGPLLRGDMLGHEGVRGLDVGEGRGCALKRHYQC